MTDVMDFINGGTKIPSANFDAVGNAVVGTILDFDVQQCRKFGTNDPEFWDDGKPKQQLVVTLQTADRDASIDEDDGKRRLYARKPSNMLTAIGDALAGQQIAKGGRLAVRFTGEKPHEKAGFNPIKEYQAAYEPPAASAAADLLGQGQAPAANPEAPAAVPAQAEPAGDLKSLL